MNDCITIQDIEFWTCIGIPEQERAKKQRLSVTVNFYTSTKKIAEQDSLHNAVDYALVTQDILQLAETTRCTIERLAEDVASMVLQNYAPEKVEVRIEKYCVPKTVAVALSITRP